MIQRIRFGLIGLSVVFLFVLLGAAIRGLGDANRGARSVPAATVNAAAPEGPREPLAELGVAPGNAPEDANGVRAAPQRTR